MKETVGHSWVSPVCTTSPGPQCVQLLLAQTTGTGPPNIGGGQKEGRRILERMTAKYWNNYNFIM